MSDLYNYLKGRSYLPQCDMTKNGCEKYLDCDVCLEDKIAEHDKQIRADVILEMKNILNIKHANIQFFEKTSINTITMFNKDSNWLAEQLKSQN